MIPEAPPGFFERFDDVGESERSGEETKADHSDQQVGPVATSFSDVIGGWRDHGPLVHQPTGIATLDELTGGGLVFTSRIFIVGAPDAGKTGVLVQLADVYSVDGLCVGLLAVDEEPGDLVTRLAQRAGWSRRDCEERDARVLESMTEFFAARRIRFYGPEFTIEGAAADLAAWAKAEGRRAFFGIDSVQTVFSEVARSAENMRDVVSSNVRAIRSVTSAHGFITVATSEMNRSAYRSAEAAASANDMASAKESGAIEYSARVLLSLRSVKGTPDLIECKVVKNKHGPSGSLHLALDRRRMSFSETDAPESDTDEANEDELREERAKAKLADDVGLALSAFAEKGSISGKTGLREALRHRGLSNGRIDLAFIELVETNRIHNEGTSTRPRWVLRQASNEGAK